MTGGVKTFTAFTGIDITAIDSSNTFDLYISISQISSTSVYFTLASQSSIPTYVNRVAYTWLSFNTGMVNSPSIGYFMVGKLTASSGGALSYTNSDSSITNFNTFVGLSGFSLKGQSSFNFDVSITEPNNIQVLINNNFNSFTFNFVVV